MHLKTQSRSALENEKAKRKLLLALCCFSVVAGKAQSQQVISSPSLFSAPIPAMPGLGGASETESAVPGSFQLFKWGPVAVRPSLSYQLLYATGIPSAPGQSQDTFIHSVSSPVTFAVGKHWVVSYSPTWTFYSNDQFQDSFGHGLSLSWQTAYEDWTFAVSENFAISSNPLIETGTQTDLITSSTALSASYRFNSKVSMDLSLNPNFSFVKGFNSSGEYSTMDYLNYQIAPKLTVGLGVGFGYVDVENGSDMTFEQLQGRVVWMASEKISLHFHAGMEDRQFLSGGAPDLINPVFGFTLGYHLFDNTLISLNASRALSPSYFRNQINEVTTVGAALNQRLFKKFQLSIGGSYSLNSYVASLNNLPINREDSFYSASVRLSYPFRNHINLAIFHQYSANSSSDTGFGYSSRQFGLEVAYHF